MEEVLQTINKHFVSLPNDEVARNNQILGEVLGTIKDILKKNPLFDELYQKMYYGGSYYDGLKVGKPDEYDVDVLFALPKCGAPTLINSDIPGFVHVRLNAMDNLGTKYVGLKKMLDKDGYLVTGKVSSWMQGVITKALEEFSNGAIIITNYGDFRLTVHKAGPAFTFKLRGNTHDGPLKMDIDLVPCFTFLDGHWPGLPYRRNPVPRKPELFVVPKQPNKCGEVERYWRLSFQMQESALLNDLGRLKPALRLLKKLRDTQDHVCIASYYIKTIFLWKVEEDRSMWHNSLTYVFKEMLREYQKYVAQGAIPYYWNRNNNLIEQPNRATLANLANRLAIIIARIERNPEDVAKYLLTPDEFAQFQAINNVTNQMSALRLSPESAGLNHISENTWLTFVVVLVLIFDAIYK